MGPFHTPPSNPAQLPPPPRVNPVLPNSPPNIPPHPPSSCPSSYSETVLNSSPLSAPRSRPTSQKWNKLTASIMTFWKKIYSKRSEYSSFLKKYSNLWEKYLSILDEGDLSHSALEVERTVGSIHNAFYKKITNQITFLKDQADILSRLALQFQQRADFVDYQQAQVEEVGEQEGMFGESGFMREEHRRFLVREIEREAAARVVETRHVYRFNEGEAYEIGERSNLAVVVKTREGEIVGGWGGTKQENGQTVPSAVIFALSKSKAYPLRKKEQGFCNFLDSFIIFGQSELQVKNLCSRILSKTAKDPYYFDPRQTSISLLQNGRSEGQAQSYDIYEIVFQEENPSLRMTVA